MNLLDEVRALAALPKPAKARAIRTAVGVSQVRLAAEIGVHRVTLVRWESGEHEPRGPARIAYAQLLEQLRQEIIR